MVVRFLSIFTIDDSIVCPDGYFVVSGVLFGC